MNAPPAGRSERALDDERRVLVALAAVQRLRLRLELQQCRQALQPSALWSQGLPLAVLALRAASLWRAWRRAR